MHQERRSLRWGLAAIAVAALWRLGGHRLVPTDGREAAQALLYLGTGRTEVTTAATEPATQPPIPTEATEPAALPSFADAAVPEIFNDPGKAYDAAALLQKPLTWQLSREAPTVLILHTHTTEGYRDTAPDYRSLEEDRNLLRIGQHLATYLESRGIHTLHDRTLHDYPSYNGSYNHSRQSAEAYLAQYPSIQVVLDLHRDAITLADGSQMATTAQGAAQLMLVVGTDTNLAHPHWQENFALALKLQALLEADTPGITRPIYLRRERFNQDLTPATLLVEVGAAGNSMEEALQSVEKLGDALLALQNGSLSVE